MVFISHRKADSKKAEAIQKYLADRGVKAYLDTLDPVLKQPIDLTVRIVEQLRKCSHLIAVFTKNTEGSYWVPFELGAAYEANKGIGTYVWEDSPQKIDLPEYLLAFPIMKDAKALDRYIDEYLKRHMVFESMKKSMREEAGVAPHYANEFIRSLKKQLGQA